LTADELREAVLAAALATVVDRMIIAVPICGIGEERIRCQLVKSEKPEGWWSCFWYVVECD